MVGATAVAAAAAAAAAAVLGGAHEAHGITQGAWTLVDRRESVGQLRSAGHARCGIDEEYKFGAFRGTENSLVVELEGGGFCYSKETCIEDVGPGRSCLRNSVVTGLGLDPELSSGIQRHDDPRNPFAAWNHLYLPYCTCDFHGGASGEGAKFVDFSQMLFGVLPKQVDRFADAKEGFGFAYNGHANVRFVIDWIKANYKAEFGFDALPERIFFTGCSAGGFGLTLHQRTFMRDFPEAKKYTLTDSAYGNIGFFYAALTLDASKSPKPFTAEERDILTESILDDVAMSDLQALVAAENPDVQFTTFAFSDDPTIGAPDTLAQMVLDNQAAGLCNVKTFIAEGRAHCVNPYEAFFTTTLVDGSTLVQAVENILDETCVETVAPESLASIGISDYDYCSASSDCYMENRTEFADFYEAFEDYESSASLRTTAAPASTRAQNHDSSATTARAAPFSFTVVVVAVALWSAQRSAPGIRLVIR